jgi:pimeloyl-ACP methyl ester carboxylesterase
MAGRRVEVPGGRLAVVADGSGPPIVLLHAAIVDARAWDPLVPHLVDAGYRAVRFDRRGFGGSTTDEIAFSNRADVVAVLDALAIGRACLVGNSQGGQVAVDTAIEFPDRVRALVTAGSNIGGFEPEPTPEEKELFAEMERLEEAADDIEAMVELDLRVWVNGPGQPSDRVAPWIQQAVRDMDRAIAGRSSGFGQPIRLEPPAAERLDALTMPVLAIAGALDVSDVTATALHLQESVPGTRAVVMPGVAHLVGMEAPERLAALIIGFLRPLGGFG